MPAPAPARGSSTCFPRRPTTASCRPSLSASARQQRRSRSCRRTRRAVTFGPMALVTTPAVVLQTYRYSETSKVVRLATRELGVQSAMEVSRSEEHTSELQSQSNLVCRLLLEKKKKQ